MVSRQLAHARTGNKDDTSQLLVIAYDVANYPKLAEHVTADRVPGFFGARIEGQVEQHELLGIVR